MKMMVKLAVLFATLLLVTGIAFAGGSCYYYEYTYTGLDNPEDSGLWCQEICFDFGNNSGTFDGFCEAGDLSLFFGPTFLNPQALLYSGDTGTEVGYLTFHGSWFGAFNGIEYCSDGGRYTVHGHKVDSCFL